MLLAAHILDSLVRLQERADVFKHGREDIFAGINLAEVHCVDWIGMIEYANVTKLADKMGMTRGAISKIGKKLLAKGFIESYQRPENGKEVYFRLTAAGKVVYNEHKKCHDEARQERLALLQNYNDDEQAIILRFLKDINSLFDRKLSKDISTVPCGTGCIDKEVH